MKRIVIFVFFLGLQFSLYAQNVSVQRTSEYLTNHKRSHGYSLTCGYDAWSKLRGIAYFSMYSRTAYEKYNFGGQLGYVHWFDRLPLNIETGIGVQQHFGGTYPKHRIYTRTPGNPFQCFYDRAVTSYVFAGLEYRKGRWSVPLQYRLGQFSVTGDQLERYSCRSDLEKGPFNLDELQYQSFTFGIRYYLREADD